MKLKFGPQLIRHFDVFTQNALGAFVVKNQSFGKVLKLGGGGELSSLSAAMKHKGGILGSLSSLCPQEGDDASRRQLPTVVQRDSNWHGTEQVVQEYPIPYIAPGGLEEHMNLLNLGSNSSR